jgi:glycosyltransferase involved in cell wall biosynthesis
MNANNPLVSVVIPTKDRSDKLPIAVESVLQQTYSNLEIIVVDDGSTVPVSLEFTDPRIKIIHLDKPKGVAAARNIALREAQGEFMCLLDDDDYYYPNKIEDQLNYLFQHPEVDIVYSLMEYNFWHKGKKKETIIHKHELIYDMYNFKYCVNVIHNNSTLFRKRVLERISFDERLTKYSDTQFYMAASLCCVIHHLPVVVAVWNIGWGTHQITARRKFIKNYKNFTILCEIFRETIDNNPLYRKKCYRQLGIYALACGDIIGAFKAFKKMLPGYFSWRQVNKS